MKRFTKCILAALSACLCIGIAACGGGGSSSSVENKGPQFLEGSLETIKIGNNVVLEEYIDYVTDGE